MNPDRSRAAGSDITVTRGFLFADLRDYTNFVERHGDDAGAELLNRYRTLVREVVATFGGAEIRTEGDAFYVLFPSASGAVQGGLAILAAARRENERDAARPIRVAIGVHAGETAETGEGPVGSAVNIAARVCSQAQAGELLVTDTVRSLTRTRLPVRFVNRGSPRLKGIAEPIALFTVTDGRPSSAAESAADARAPVRGVRRLTPAVRLVAIGAVVLAVMALVAWAGLFRGPAGPASSSLALLAGSSPTAPNGTGSPSGAGASGGGASGSPSASSSACSVSASRETVPALTDVPFYRADSNRDSVFTGPGPDCQPVVAWQRSLAVAPIFVPIVVAGKVIVGDKLGLHAFDARTGTPTWNVTGAGPFFESAGANNGVIFAADLDGTLHAIDAATGAQRWATPLPNAGIQPLVADGLVWVGSSDGNAYGLDPANGTRSWEWAGPAGVQARVNIVTKDTAYIGAGGSLYAVRLVDKTVLWRFDANGTDLTGPVLGSDAIYVAGRGSGQDALYAVDLATGKNRWGPPFAIASGLQVTPGPFSAGVLYVTTDGDGVYALADRGTSWTKIWQNADVGTSNRPAALTLKSQTLYVQQQEGTLLALDPRDGHELWDTTPDAPATIAPVISGGMVFQVDDEANVLRAWATPTLIALLGGKASSPSRSVAPPAPDPFTVTADYPWFQTGIAIPAGIAIGPDGLLYVLHAKADYSDPMVTVVDPKTGLPVRSWGQYGSGPGQLDLTATGGNGPGGCIFVAPNGLVFVGDHANKRVDVFKDDGTPVRQFGVGQLGGILSCALGPDGSFYTGEGGPSSDEMTRFDPKGNLVWQTLTDPQHPEAQFQVHGFTFMTDGKILGFIDSGGAVKIDPANGRVIGDWNYDAPSLASGEPTVDAAGRVYVFAYVTESLQVFDPTGHLLGGRYDSGPVSGYQFSGHVFWPPPVFDKDGFGYTFGPDGLVQLRVTLP